MLWQLLCLTVTNDCSLNFTWSYYAEVWRLPLLCVIVNHNVCSLLLRVTEGSFKLRSSMVAKTLYEYGRSRWSAGQGTPAASAPRNRSDSELVDLAVTVDGFPCSMLGYGRVLNLDCLKQISFRSKSTLTSFVIRRCENEEYTPCRMCTQKIARLKRVFQHRPPIIGGLHLSSRLGRISLLLLDWRYIAEDAKCCGDSDFHEIKE